MPSLCSRCPNYGYKSKYAKNKRCLVHPTRTNTIRLFNCKDFPQTKVK